MLEFYCNDCKKKFEQITSKKDPDWGKCPHCGKKNTEKQVPLFRVGGRGDLRESTMHGCHEADPGHGGHDHGHNQGHGDSGDDES